MLIHEASQTTGVTRKAIEYYCERGLLFPSVMENGYRDFSKHDIQTLQKISAMRKLGMHTGDIQSVLLDTANDVFRRYAVQTELQAQTARMKTDILEMLCAGTDMNDPEIQARLDALESKTDITQRILQAFPSSFGRFICLHFARFLNEPAVTPTQKAALSRVIRFLDSTAALHFPENLQPAFRELSPDSDIALITNCFGEIDRLLKAPDQYLEEHREMITRSIDYRQSEAYRQSPAHQLQVLTRAFMASSGYNEVFIPAMRELSPSYAVYHAQLQAANEAFLRKYPQAASD